MTRTSISRFLLEAVVIVGSILLAFGIQAAWDERKVGIEQRDNLTALLTDLDDVIREATERIEQDEARIADITQLADSLRSAEPPANDALVALLGRMQKTFFGS